MNITKKRLNKFVYIISAFVLFVVTLVLTGGAVVLPVIANADTIGADSVITDLSKDDTFTTSDYPIKRGDYSLNVIQIGESANGELFIYVYQPSGDNKTKATTISIAEQLNNSDELQPVLYSLKLVDRSLTLYKYKVEKFAVSNAKERFYNLIMIQRPFISGVDNESGNGTTTDRKAYGIGQYWYATTDKSKNVSYKMLNVEVVEIINPFASRIRNKKASSSNFYYQDNYYIAFSTNRNIDNLLSATVSYRIQDYFYKENNVLGFDSTSFWEKSVFSNEKLREKDIYANEVIDLEQQGFTLLFGLIDLNEKYSWGRIQSSADFIKNAGASSSDNDEVKKLQWVLMFDEVSVYQYQSTGGLISRVEENGQIIDNVTVLRLEFIENGITYNLGTVSDTVSGEHNFGGSVSSDKDKNILWWVWLIVAVVALFIIGLLCALIKPLFNGVKFVLKWLWYIVSAPFRFIAWLIQKIIGSGGD